MTCLKCGECCFPYGLSIDYDPDTYRFYSYHGMIIKEAGDKMLIYWRSPCSMLLFKDDGTTACGVYADRPEICRGYTCKRAKQEGE
jgi:Fe-S-cluster containining protein